MLAVSASAAGAQNASAEVFAPPTFTPVAEAFLHPRCTNCHVGDSNLPGWDGLGYGADAVHGMAVNAGDSRIGAEGLPCRTCHVTSLAANITPHAAPHIDAPWQLPPVALAWQGATAAELCRQLRDPARTEDRDIAEIADHVRTSAFVAWGFEPGAGRSAPKGSPQALARAILAWGAAGTPCD